MRKNELHLLDRKRPSDEDDFDRFFANTLGISLAHLQELADELLNDLDPKKFGFGWWTQYQALGDKRRIYVSDCLCQVVHSVPDNMVEARLHLFEMMDWLDIERKHMRDAVRVDAGGRPTLKPLLRAREGLDQRMVHLHAAGFFRAINSAFDCLGGVVIGVVGLRSNILTADLGRARHALRSIKAPTTAAERAQVEFRDGLDGAITSAGPQGWLEWTSNFRNMVTHRGRRMQFGKLHGERTKVTDARGRSHILTRLERSFPAEPAWCDVDATLQPRGLMLGEDSLQTAEGILSSATFLIEQSALALLEFWRRRRNDPSLVEQPTAQWSNVQCAPGCGFDGYSGKLGEMGDAVAMNPRDIKRYTAAALTSDDRNKWIGFT